jgi:hypothetical protein
MSITSASTWSGAMPPRPKKVTGSSAVFMPLWETVSMRTVCPDRMRRTGGASAAK